MVVKNKNLFFFAYDDIGKPNERKVRDYPAGPIPNTAYKKLVDFCHKRLKHKVRYAKDLTEDEMRERSDWCNEHFKGVFCLWRNQIACRYSEDLILYQLRWE